MDEEEMSNILKIISSNGNDKESWENLICDVNSGEQNINDLILNLNENLKNKTNVEITLDIVDSLVNYGTPEIIELIAKKEFLSNILELLKNSSKSSVDIQKKIIFLTQKWAKQFENCYDSNYSGFLDIYNSLKKGGIIFPPSNFKLITYTKYISDEEAECAQMKGNNIKKLKEDNEKSIKVKIVTDNNFANPFSFESGEINDKEDKKIYNNESIVSENKINANSEDEENPYKENINNNQNNDNEINNINKNNNIDNNDDNFYPLGHPKNKNKIDYNNMNNESNQQKSKYPKFPSQIGNINNLKNNNNNAMNNDNNMDNNNNFNQMNNLGNNNSNNNNMNYNNNINNNMNNNNRGNSNEFNNNQQNLINRNRSNTTGNRGNFNNQFSNNFNNNNNNYNNNNYNNNNYNYNNNRRRYYYYYYGNNNNNNYINSIRNRYNEGIRKFCLAQAFVYEKLLESNKFDEVDWKNQINENEEGELIILPNSHRYKVKKSMSNYDFIVKTHHNKQYKISVKRGTSSRNSYLKFSFNYSQWNMFNTEQQSIIIAFVSLNNENNPEIYFAKNIDLSEL